MHQILLYTLLFSVLFQSGVLIIATISSRRNPVWRANVFFGFFVILLAYIGILNFFVASDLIGQHLWLIFTWNAVGISLGPLLFCYVEFLLYPDRRFRLRDFAHFIPGMSILIFLTAYSYINPLNQLSSGAKVLQTLYPLFIFQQLFGLIYLSKSFLAIKRFEKFVVDHFSNIDGYKINWLKHVLRCAFIFWAFALWQHWFTGKEDASFYKLASGLVFLSVLSMYAMRKTLSFCGVSAQNIQQSSAAAAQYSSSSLTSHDVEEYVQKLKDKMNEDKIYRNPDLKLNDLAEAVGLTSYQTSQVLNLGVGKCFYDFVNQYRIDEACDRLEKSPSDKILAVALEVGFNSKSTFNAAFKKKTGTTPSEYRN